MMSCSAVPEECDLDESEMSGASASWTNMLHPSFLPPGPAECDLDEDENSEVSVSWTNMPHGPRLPPGPASPDADQDSKFVL